jgi:hypothetical protein
MDTTDTLKLYGINNSVNTHENNALSRKAAIMETLQKESLGKDVLGKEIFVNEKQADHLYRQMYNKDGSPKLHTEHNRTQFSKDLEMMKADVSKTYGRGRVAHLDTPGAMGGQGLGWQGNRLASGGTMLSNGLSGTARLTAEGGLNALGLMTRQQKLMFSQGGMFAKAMAVAPAAFSLYNMGSTIFDGGDIGDALAMNVTAAAGMAGFHAGKSLAGAMSSGMSFMGHKAFRTTAKEGGRWFGAGKVVQNIDGSSKIVGGKLRIGAQFAGGLVGGAVATGVVAGITYGAQDLTSSESSIAKAARGYSKLSELADVTQNRGTLTMRQRALQQLSQSALNDRGSLLGNEASILKNLL